MQANPKPTYIGRYAPSPTGDLHLGNLRTALVAWLHARLSSGVFVLRMEDLDTPRVVSGSADKILHDLEWLGLDWDGEILYQSGRLGAYRRALEILGQLALTYPCFCSRKDIQQAASAPHGREGVYPGTCANLPQSSLTEKTLAKTPAIRMRVDVGLRAQCGDFVIKRADGLFAYQLAVVVDDLAQGITHAIRGADLQSSTARQVFLAQCLAQKSQPISYLHAPLLSDVSGKRMSKRDGSESVGQWRQTTGTAESLIGYLTASLGLTKTSSAISLPELLSSLTLDQLERCFD